MSVHDHDDEIEDSSAPLIEHLAELRTRLIHSVMAFILGMVICFTVWNPIFNFLTHPLCDAMAARGQGDCGLILIKLQEGFFVAISISLLGGLVLAFPYISYQMWRFVAPGLYRSEKGAFLPFLIASPFMFFLGASFAFYIVTPLAFDFFLGFQQPGTVIEGTDENSVLLTLMGKAGLVSSRGLRSVRKYAVVGILVLAALVTPPDVITQVILFVVVYGLYEISIQLVRRVERQRDEKLREEGVLAEGESLDDIYDEFDDEPEPEDPKS